MTSDARGEEDNPLALNTPFPGAGQRFVAFFQRPFPSANAILLQGPRPVLVDPGFGSDTLPLIAWLQAQAIPPERHALIVNTHFDCDHVGANHALAESYALPIAAHHIEATAVNARDPAACRARYLHQPVEPYRVAWALQEGDVIDTGTARWIVLHTPGHTAGHISLHAPDQGLLVVGDTVHSDDLGWIDVTQPEMLDATAATLQRLAALPLRCAWSGHGPATQDPAAAIAEAARRLQAWRQSPERMAWHGAKRILAYNLMVSGGLTEPALASSLLASPWFHAYAALPFGLAPADFIAPLLAEMLRSGAAAWQAGRLVATAPHNPPLPGWASAATEPAQWPP